MGLLRVTLYYVDLPYACFGIVVDEQTQNVIEAPPIAAWACGMPFWKFMDYVRRSGGRLTAIPGSATAQ